MVHIGQVIQEMIAAEELEKKLKSLLHFTSNHVCLQQWTGGLRADLEDKIKFVEATLDKLYAEKARIERMQ